MTDKKIPLEYTNSLMYDLEKAFWDERGKGARFRTTKVGQAYFTDKFLPLIEFPELDHILQIIQNVLQEEGIAGSVSYEKEDRLLSVQVEGCIHRNVEDRMLEKGIEPFTCIPANLIVLAIEDVLNKPVELAEIKIEDGTCQLILVVFEERPTLE
jgi:hypothetical protein